MKNIFNESNLHQIIVEIFTILSADETEYLLMKAKHFEEFDDDVNKYLQLCVRMASELRRNPHCYDTLDVVCKTIVNRQKNANKVYKKDYLKLLGLNYPMELKRIEQKERPMKLENIENICKGFQDKIVRWFWENQLLIMFPYVKVPKRSKEVAYTCLNVICRGLKENQFKYINEKLGESTKSYWEMFMNEALKDEIDSGIYSYLKTESIPSLDDCFGQKPPYKLYNIINSQAKKKEMTIMEIAEDELGISLNTWYDWKNNWEQMEQYDTDKLPNKRLSRIHLLVLSVLFDFTYCETVVFLATAGYHLYHEEPDKTVIQYMNRINISKNKFEVRQFLQDYMFQSSKW